MVNDGRPSAISASMMIGNASSPNNEKQNILANMAIDGGVNISLNCVEFRVESPGGRADNMGKIAKSSHYVNRELVSRVAQQEYSGNIQQ